MLETTPRDRIIPLSGAVPRSNTAPFSMGCFASTDPNAGTAEEVAIEASIEAALNGERIIYTGDFRDEEHLTLCMSAALEVDNSVPFALFAHWSQVDRLDRDFVSLFQTVYVAVDKAISKEEIAKINAAVQPHSALEWVFMPRPEINWSKWIARDLMPGHRGTLTILAPKADSPDGPFLNADELRLRLADFEVMHPLIQVRPAPGTWFVHEHASANDPDYLYRSSLDPEIHQHFFRSLGKVGWWRGGMKRIFENKYARVVAVPVVGVLTLFASERPLFHLRSFARATLWGLNRGFAWIRNQTRKQIQARTRKGLKA